MTNNNIFLNWISQKLVHQAKATKADGTVQTFWNISFPYDQSASGFASVSVSNGQVMTARKKDGTTNDNFKNVLLGAPAKVRQVSIKNTDGSYSKVELTNAQILDIYEASRKAYNDAHPAANTAAAAPVQVQATASQTANPFNAIDDGQPL